jgi:phage baseplate assembly protein W
MSTYYGFSTQNINATRSNNVPTGLTDFVGTPATPITGSKKYRITDDELVILDYLNALNIPQGSKPGKPSYGTNIYNFIFEPNTPDTVSLIQEELLRVSRMDPRIIINSINVYSKENSVIAEIELAISPRNEAQTLSIIFDQQTNTASMS